MASTVCDPELLSLGRWAVDRESIIIFVVCGCSLHLGSIVSVAQLSETEASHVLQTVDCSHKRKVPISAECHQRTAKQVELYSEFCGKGSVDKAEHFVSCEDIFGVLIEVKN